MSSKAEKTSHHLYHQPRLSIFFRNPLLLKIVAWLGSLSFIGSTGVVWADLKPISTSQAEAQALQNASASAEIVATGEGQIYGPYLPITQTQSPIRFAPAQLPNREVPIAVAPASASISPTGKIVRPQHTDLLTAEHYTVGVNSDLAQITTAEFVNLPVPAPLSTIIPSQIREIVTTTRSQIQPSYVATSTASQSAPATSIQPQATAASSNGYRAVPTVVSLPAAKSISPRIDRSRTILTLPQRPTISTQGTPLTGIKPIITPMKSAAMRTLTAQSEPRSTDIITAGSIEILVPAPKTQRIEVQAVARLPQISEIKTVPVVSTIPSVRPSQSPVAFTSTGQNELSELIYPLSAPAPTTSSFGWRTHPITGSRRFHSGVDIGAPTGAPVVAAGSGTIVSSGWLGGYGKAIVVQHNGVQQTLYGHLSEIFVQPGQIVEQGTVIGRVGSTGNSTGPHLHYETRVSTPDGWIAVDPGENIKYALDHLRRSMPFAQRDLPPGYN